MYCNVHFEAEKKNDITKNNDDYHKCDLFTSLFI